MKFAATPKIVSTSIILIGIVYFVLLINYRWKGEYGKNHEFIISSDGAGYYDHLPYFFIDGHAKTKTFDYRFHVRQNGKNVNKYFIGTALCQSPFFFGAYCWSKISGAKCDARPDGSVGRGFSTPFQIAISLAGLTYFLLSLIFIRKILEYHFNFSSWVIALTLTLFSFGSMLLFYTLVDGSFSHIYSVFFSAFFFWQVSKIAREKYRNATIVLLVFAFSMIVLIRPVNVLLVLFVPFFFKDFGSLKVSFLQLFKNRKALVLGIMFSLALFMLQSLAWYAQCGKFMVWSYKNEGFNFTDPEIINFLFSYRKGLFVYSPLFFVSLFGLYFIYKDSKWKFYWAISALSIIVYILSSWWCWFYAGGFGMRPMADFSIIFILLFAIFISGLKQNFIQTIFGLITGACIVLNLVFSLQFYKGIINPYSMDANKFWHVFLKTGDTYKNYFGGMHDTKPYAPNGFELITNATKNFDDKPSGNVNTRDLEFPVKGIRYFDPNAQRSGANHFIRLKMKRKMNVSKGGTEMCWVIKTKPGKDSKSSLYYTIRVKEYKVEKAGLWINSEYTVSFFNGEFTGQEFEIFIHNPSKEEMIIDDVTIEVFAAKN